MAMKDGMNCPDCGEAAVADANFCVSCGSRLSAGCPSCGVGNPDGSRFCRVCGVGLVGATAPTPPRLASLSCPRCRAFNTAGVDFCYSCGLPFDESHWQQAAQPAYRAYPGVPAGFWIRLLAWLIDLMALIATELAIVAVFPGMSFAEYWDGSEFVWTFNHISFFLGIAYHTLGVSLFSTTIGKRLLGLYVLRRDGSKISPLRAFCRYLASILSFLILFIGVLIVAFRQDKRALHDMICDTVVVKK